MGGLDRGSAPTEGIQNHVSGIGTGEDDPFKQRERFLCGIAVQQAGGGAAPRIPAPVRSRRSGRTVVVAARGLAEALRLPNVGELANEVEGGLGEPWLDASVHSEDHTAAGGVPGRRLHPPGAGS